jgi:membrane protein YdbS with pleckstrin-like domain
MRLGPVSIFLANDELIPAIEVDPNSVTPGVVGFLATLLVAAVVLLLIADMVRRVRRVRYRAEINEKLDAEESTKPAAD